MRVLAIDIETRPMTVLAWGLWSQDIGINQIVEPTSMLCFAAKFIGEKEMYCASDFYDGHDAMVQKAWQLLDDADVLLTYNGHKFDLPHLRREFVEADLRPPSPCREIDLYSAVKREFKFPSAKLQYVSTALKI